MAPFGHILRIESSESLLNRLSQTDLRSDHLTPFQTHIDQLISQGTQEITNTTAIVSMMSGSLAYKSARVGVLGIMGSGSGWLTTLLRPASVGLGLCAEVVAF
ncbi:MAG: hypothetical protein JNK65_05155, partial [Deltaproteobacteria bacterium]|nr:hypothetical protein [Deltaproteobacteria bacterium]